PRPEARRQHDGDDATIAAGTWRRHEGAIARRGIARGVGCIFRRRMLWARLDNVKPEGLSRLDGHARVDACAPRSRTCGCARSGARTSPSPDRPGATIADLGLPTLKRSVNLVGVVVAV